MKFLLGIIMFVIGFVLGVFTRNILMKLISVKNKIKMAEKIIAEEEKRKEFKRKYDFDLDDDNKED